MIPDYIYSNTDYIALIGAIIGWAGLVLKMRSDNKKNNDDHFERIIKTQTELLVKPLEDRINQLEKKVEELETQVNKYKTLFNKSINYISNLCSWIHSTVPEDKIKQDKPTIPNELKEYI
jgi:TolA-binding protein